MTRGYLVGTPLLPSHCGFFFMPLDADDLFWQVPAFFINGCPAVSCDFGVSMRRGKLKAFPLHHIERTTTFFGKKKKKKHDYIK